MTLQLIDLVVEGYRPDNPTDEPDYRIGADSVETMEISSRIQDQKDEADLEAIGVEPPVRSGDRLEIKIEDETTAESFGEEYGTGYGVGYGGGGPGIPYGNDYGGGYGGLQELTPLWTGMARDISETIDSPSIQPTRRLDISAEDYVFTLLSFRNVFASFSETAISGADDAIVETLLRTAVAGEDRIDLSQIESVGQSTDVFFDGTNLFEAVTELRDRAGALMAADGEALVFKPFGNLSVKHPLTPEDVLLPIEREREDDELRNQIRVDGATAAELEASSAQETVVAERTVTDTDRALYQLSTRKSELARIELWTADSALSGDLRVRIQKSNAVGDAPIAADDQESDVVSAQLSSEFLADDDFTTFDLPEHTLPETTDFFLIIESTETGGQRIGVDSNNVPAVRPFFAFPIAARGTDKSSIQTHRRRDKRLRKDNVDTVAAAQGRVNSELRRDTSPRQRISFGANSVRAHQLNPGEVVDLDLEIPGFPTGEHIVIERTDEYAGTLLQTELELAPLEELL